MKIYLTKLDNCKITNKIKEIKKDNEKLDNDILNIKMQIEELKKANKDKWEEVNAWQNLKAKIETALLP